MYGSAAGSSSLLAEARTVRALRRRVRNVEQSDPRHCIVPRRARRALRRKVFRRRESARAFVQGVPAGEEDDAIEDAVDLRTRLVDRRDYRRRVVRVVREGVQDRDDFGGGDRIEAW